MIILRNELQDLFDVITFYKPIKVVSKENHFVFHEILKLFKIFVFYWLFSLGIIILVSRALDINTFSNTSVIFLDVFLFFFAQALVSSFFAFLISRIFSKTGSFLGLLGLNYYLLSAISILFLVSSVPLAEFSGLIFFMLGSGLYLFFLNELFSAFFQVSGIKSLVITIFYVFGVLLLVLLLVYLQGIFP